jgi:hypothetical protein
MRRTDGLPYERYFAQIFTQKIEVDIFPLRMRYFLTKNIRFGWFSSIDKISLSNTKIYDSCASNSN